MLRLHANGFRQTLRQGFRFLRAVAVIFRFVRDERIIFPHRHTVLTPIRRKRVTRERFAGIPFALAVMQQRAGREFIPQTLDEFAGQNSFFLRDGGEIPFGTIGIIHGNKGRLAAHREAHIAFFQINVNLVTKFLDGIPLLFRVGLGDARRFVNALHRHVEFEFGFAFVHAAGNRRGARRIGRAGERNVTFTREQSGSGIKANPASARQINFRPRVQIREIFFRAARAIERFDVRLELDQIAADKARGEAEVSHQLHQQPRGVTAGTAHLRKRFFRRLHARFHADGVFDVLPKPLVDGDDEIIRRRFFTVRHFQPLLFRAPLHFADQVTA